MTTYRINRYGQVHRNVLADRRIRKLLFNAFTIPFFIDILLKELGIVLIMGQLYMGQHLAAHVHQHPTPAQADHGQVAIQVDTRKPRERSRP